jgi:hypothetical protein
VGMMDSNKSTQVESIAAEQKGDIFLPNVSPVEAGDRVESTPVFVEAPTTEGYIPGNRAEKRSFARPQKGGSSCSSRQMPVGSLDSLLRFRGR